MTRTTILLLAAAILALTACGIRRPLLRPKDIPSYEKKREQRLERFGDPNTVDNDADDDNAVDNATISNATGNTTISNTVSPPVTSNTTTVRPSSNTVIDTTTDNDLE